MADARRRDEWSRAAAISAAAYNAQRTRRDLVSVASCNPYTAQQVKRKNMISDPFILAAMCGVAPSE